MRIFLVPAVILLGLAAGSALTVHVTGPASGDFSRKVGVWAFSPTVGAREIDPYTRARLFVSGELPLASGEGYTLRTSSDMSGAPLEAQCRYVLSGPFPPARYWTVTLSDKSGKLHANLAERQGFTSAEIIRENSGAFSIAIGPETMAGNWLPTPPEAGAFSITLRFYETPLAATATRFDSRALPKLTRLRCPA